MNQQTPSTSGSLDRRRFLAYFCGLGLPARIVTAQTKGEAPTRQRSSLRVAALTLTSRGFDPPAVRLRSGQTLFIVYNQSGADEVDFVVERQIGASKQNLQQVRRERVPKERFRWKNILDLQQGVYIVRDADRPKWTCEVTVE